MNHKYSCIIVDDEPKAIELLTDKLTELYDNLTITGNYTDWKSAFAVLKDEQPDILFMDIQMPQKTGMDLLRIIPGLKSEIIFITAYTDYAIDAFEFPVSGYVLKPLKDEQLVKAVNTAVEKIYNRRVAAQKTADVKVNSKIGIPNSKGTDYIDMADIIYLEATKRYTKVVSNTSEIISSYSIGKFKDILEHQSFFQVHRSYIINLNYIKRYISTGLIIMSNNAEIPVSKNTREEFVHLFEKVAKTSKAAD